MHKSIRAVAWVSLLSATASFAGLPLTTQAAVAAMKKGHATKSSKSSMKAGSATSGGAKGKTGDPLNAAAGKKM